MECPNCEVAEIIILHTDVVECNDCGATIEIGYCVCPNCHYSFRMNNGEFLDEMQMSHDSLNEVIDDLEDILSDPDIDPKWFVNSPHIGSMLDLLHPCVKCGETMTAYDPKTGEYECLDCGFKWGILTNE